MSGEVVLVVEDTELLRRMYADKLTQDGYSVLPAADGLEALSLLKTHTVDLILLDLVMPRMSGLEMLDVIKKDPRIRHIPVIILSNLGQESDVQKGVEMGAVDYLVKNEARPADVSVKITAILTGAVAAEPAGADGSGDMFRAAAGASYRLQVRDREGDAEALISAARMPRRFWCPSCEVELVLELVPQPRRTGWYDAHFECPECHREY